jgi:2-iminobutanoate/2-iminopropanoate deaminase
MAVAAVLALTGCQPPTTSTVYLHPDKPSGPLSASVLSGDLCFVSGTVGADRETFEAEATAALVSLERELGRAGLTLSELVQVTVYLTDMSNYEAFNEIYAARMSEPYPARAVVEVRALPREGRIEIQAIARKR